MRYSITQLVEVCHGCPHRREALCTINLTRFVANCRAEVCPGGYFDHVEIPPVESAQHLQPIPPEKWNTVVRWFARHAAPKDLGLGDVVERMIEDSRLGRFARRLIKLLPLDCGCEERRHRWNTLFPLSFEPLSKAD